MSHSHVNEGLGPARHDAAQAPAMSSAAFALAFVATALFFWPSLASFPSVWDAGGFSHGWAVGAFTGWLIWRHRRDLTPGPRGEALMFVPVVGLSLVWLLAVVASLRVVHLMAFAALLACWALVVLGRRSARVVLAIGATFLLAIPLWNPLVPMLRRLTVIATGFLAWLARVPAEIDGDFVTIESGTFLVADGCAGLNYLLAGLAIGAAYAHLFLEGWRARTAVIALAAAVAIAGNWIRVTMLVVIGHVTQMQAAVIENHGWLGWIVFTAGMLPFFWMAGRIQGRGASVAGADQVGGAEPIGGDEANAGTAGTEHETSPHSEPPPLLRSPRSRTAVASLAAVSGPLLYFMLTALPTVVTDDVGVEGLPAGAAWQLVASPGERPLDWEPAFVGATETHTGGFSDGAAHVFAERLVYRNQAQGSELIGYTNQIAPQSDILDDRVIGPVDAEGRRWIRQAVVRAPRGRVLVWYWFRVGGVDTFSPVQAKVLDVWAFFRRRPTAELIALAAACVGDDCAPAFASLRSFVEGE